MSCEQQGKFIVLYGANNLGKSTHVTMLVDALEEMGVRVTGIKYPVYNLEPTGSRLNAILRDGLEMPEIEVQRLYAQNRRDFEPTLRAHLNSGIWVVAEDYTGTGVAWGLTRGVSLEALEAMNEGLLQEDLAILLHGERFTSGIEQNHRNEKDDELWYRAQEFHLALAGCYGWRKVSVDETRSKEVVHQDILTIVQGNFNFLTESVKI